MATNSQDQSECCLNERGCTIDNKTGDGSFEPKQMQPALNMEEIGKILAHDDPNRVESPLRGFV